MLKLVFHCRELSHGGKSGRQLIRRQRGRKDGTWHSFLLDWVPVTCAQFKGCLSHVKFYGQAQHLWVIETIDG